MGDKEEKFKILKVLVEQVYIVPMVDDERTRINGWTIEEVIEDWFQDHSLNSFHATREGHLIGHSKKVIKTEIGDLETQ